MRSFMMIVAAILGLTLFFGCTQDTPTSVPRLGPPNSIGIFFDRHARTTSINLDPEQTFSIYVIAFNLTGDVAASRFGISGLLKIEDDPDPIDKVQIIAEHVYPEGNGSDQMPELPGLYWLDHGECSPAEGAVILMRIEARLTGAVENYPLVLGPNWMLPDADCPASPGYVRCDGSNGCMFAAYEGTAIINPGK